VGHEVFVKLSSTTIVAVETYVSLRRLSLSYKCRDELCSMLGRQLKCEESPGRTVAVS
jgi:hypothetical protein